MLLALQFFLEMSHILPRKAQTLFDLQLASTYGSNKVKSLGASIAWNVVKEPIMSALTFLARASFASPAPRREYLEGHFPGNS